MRVKRIQVQGLFGQHDYDLVLKPTERVTLLFGENGCGKTTVLRLIDALFAARWATLSDVRYQRLAVELDDGSVVSADGCGQPGGHPADSPGIALRGPDGQTRTVCRRPEVPQGGALGEDRWAAVNNWLAASRSFHERAAQGPSQLESLSAAPEWPVLTGALGAHPAESLLASGREAIEAGPVRSLASVKLIDTERLLRIDAKQAARAVEANAVDLRRRIAEANAEYARVSQDLDRTFPHRLLGLLRQSSAPIGSLVAEPAVVGAAIGGLLGPVGVLAGALRGAALAVARSSSELHSQLVDLDRKASALREIGLLPSDQPMELPPAVDLKRQAVYNALRLYALDWARKLHTLDPIAAQVTALGRVIAERFAGKQLVVDREAGLVVALSDGVRLPLSRLSSGEQHLLVIMYELLFRVEPDTLVLIDEPEISLHITWQRQMVRNLIEAAKAGRFDVLVATHSPEIIYDRWDLAVGLAPEDVA